MKAGELVTQGVAACRAVLQPQRSESGSELLCSTKLCFRRAFSISAPLQACAVTICSGVKCLVRAVIFTLSQGGREGGGCITTSRHSFTTSGECKRGVSHSLCETPGCFSLSPILGQGRHVRTSQPCAQTFGEQPGPFSPNC